MTKRDIIALIDDSYGTDPASSLEQRCAKLAAVRSAIAALPDDGRYALVADEL